MTPEEKRRLDQLAQRHRDEEKFRQSYPRHKTQDAIHRRYPNLIRACQRAALLSPGEAVSGIQAYLMGSNAACEAVNYYGGTATLLTEAIRLRHL